MNLDQLQQMSGPELAAEAAKCRGWKIQPEGGWWYGVGADCIMPHDYRPDENIEQAWELVELEWQTFHGAGGPRYGYWVYPDYDGWHCNVEIESAGVYLCETVADTGPRAITIAYVLAKEYDDEK